MHYRPATMADAPLLLAWRNDPQTRANSLDTAEVSPQTHGQWLRLTTESNFRDLWIAEEAGEPVGTVRVDWHDNWPNAPPSHPELSWTVAPEHRGKGYGKRMVSGFVAAHPASYSATIKAGNSASLLIAEAARLRVELVSAS